MCRLLIISVFSVVFMKRYWEVLIPSTLQSDSLKQEVGYPRELSPLILSPCRLYTKPFGKNRPVVPSIPRSDTPLNLRHPQTSPTSSVLPLGFTQYTPTRPPSSPGVPSRLYDWFSVDPVIRRSPSPDLISLDHRRLGTVKG